MNQSLNRMFAIETCALEKTFLAGFWRKSRSVALHPLTLEVPEGQVFGYLGPNGAGKTTTLKLLMGLVFPTGGSARILGMHYLDPRVKMQIGFLPEQPYFYDYLTASELLDYYAQLSGVPAAGNARSASADSWIAWDSRDERQAPASQVFQGHVAARGTRPGHHSRSQAGVSGRAHVRAGSRSAGARCAI